MAASAYESRRRAAAQPTTPAGIEKSVVLAGNAVRAADASGGSQWQIWMATTHLLLDTPDKAIQFAEAVVRAAYGIEQVEEERPFTAEDFGSEWKVQGTGRGVHAMPFFAVSSTVILAKKTGAVIDYRLSMPGAHPPK